MIGLGATRPSCRRPRRSRRRPVCRKSTASADSSAVPSSRTASGSLSRSGGGDPRCRSRVRITTRYRAQPMCLAGASWARLRHCSIPVSPARRTRTSPTRRRPRPSTNRLIRPRRSIGIARMRAESRTNSTTRTASTFMQTFRRAAAVRRVRSPARTQSSKSAGGTGIRPASCKGRGRRR